MAKPLLFYIPVSHVKPKTQAEGRLLWDDEFLYVAIKAPDKDIKAKLEKRDSAVFRDDVLETFLKPVSDQPIYYNFEINALGTVYDSENIRIKSQPGDKSSRPRMKTGPSWNCPKFKHAVKVNGTMCDDSDQDKFWTLEAAIPFAGLPALNGKSPTPGSEWRFQALNGKSPTPGSEWRFHLARYDYSKYIENGKELSSTAPLSAVNFHKTEDFVPLRFVK
jgi:hypothetical protein